MGIKHQVNIPSENAKGFTTEPTNQEIRLESTFKKLIKLIKNIQDVSEFMVSQICDY
jgi:hypothetical protein